MRKSEQIDQLAVALAKAQAEIKGAIKDSQNPFFKSQYADLSSVWEASHQALNKNGLSVVQPTEITERGTVLTTMLLHVSGQWISGDYPVESQKGDPQSKLAALTYARRGALAALVMICPLDDDGESAMDRNKKPGHVEPVEAGKAKGITEAQRKRLFAISKSANWTQDEVADRMSAFGVGSSKDLNWIQYDELCKYIEANPK